MSVMQKIGAFSHRLMHGPQQEDEEKYSEELYEEALSDARKELTGKYLLSELQDLKDRMGEDYCMKCRRTRRTYCNRCQNTLKGIDHLAGQIAERYTDKKSRWKEDEPQ